MVIEQVTDQEWVKKLELSAAKIGAQIHVIPHLIVDYSQSYEDAISAATSDRGGSAYIYQVENLYEPGIGRITEFTVLLNFKEGRHSYQQEVIEWGIVNGLRRSTPHIPYAVAEHFSNLKDYLAPTSRLLRVVETTGCMHEKQLRAACIQWRNTDDETDVTRCCHFPWQKRLGVSTDWFAFCK